MEKLLELKNICKSFGPVQVLEDVSLDVYKGEVVALSGENGAGKSTLMKIVVGLYPPSSGEVYIRQQKYSQFNLTYSRQVGVSLIYQELSIAPNITVMENIFMGSEFRTFGFTQKNRMNEKTNEILALLNADFKATQKAGDLSIAQQQQIEIARAISHNSDLIIMDEPTASLSSKEVNKLFGLIRSLKKQGITIIFISHRMDEVKQIADRVAVLRDGKYIGDSQVDDMDRIIYMMVGRSIQSFYDKENDVNNVPEVHDEKTIKDTTLTLENLSDEHGFVNNVSCTLNSGKLIGVAGLVGAGRSELARLVFGADKKKTGKIYIDNQEVSILSPIDAIENGMGMIPEDRKLQGLFLEMSSLKNIAENKQISHAYYKFILNKKKNLALAKEWIEKFNIKTTIPKKPKELSGGNQQKVLLSRWLAIAPRILIFDEPTRGVDVGAKQEIYKMVRKIVNLGALVIFISSELLEIIHLSDRVLVMRDGELVADIIDREKITQEHIISLCTSKGLDK